MKERDHGASSVEQESQTRAKTLVDEIRMRGLQEVSQVLARESERTIAALLSLLPDGQAAALLPALEGERRTAILRAAPSAKRDQWLHKPTLFPRKHRLLHGAGGGDILASHDRSRDGGTTAKSGQGGVHHLRLCGR